MIDPYRVLGISHDATDREIRLAWKTLKRTYRPMPFRSKELRGYSKERYRQLLEAYRQLQGVRQRDLERGTEPLLQPRTVFVWRGSVNAVERLPARAFVRAVVRESVRGSDNALIRTCPID